MFKELNVLRIFFEKPAREFNVREVARIKGISPATASSKLKKYTKENILKERRERNLLLYRANVESDDFRDVKVYYNIRELRRSGLIEELNKFYMRPTIVLFGSSSKGLDAEESDFDLLVISEKTKEIRDLGKYEKKLKRGIHLFLVERIRDLKNEHLINNVLNGVIIQGDLRWI